MAAHVASSAEAYPRLRADERNRGETTQHRPYAPWNRARQWLASRTRSASPRAFLVSTATALVVGLMGIFAFSWYVNPWGDFGTTGFHKLYNAHLAKANYLDAMPRGELPQVVVLGSSITMQYSPATIQRLLGKSAFNFGVFGGCTDDFLCITHHLIEDLQHRPELLILGLDTFSFILTMSKHPVFPGTRRQLLNTPQLVRHLLVVNPVKLVWSNVIDALSRQQLRLSWKLFRDDRYQRRTAQTLEATKWFDIDGTRTRYVGPTGSNIFEAVEAGTYQITNEIRESIDTMRRSGSNESFLREYAMYNFVEMDQTMLDHMTKLLTLCQREQIPIVVIINPAHPLLYRELILQTRHAENLDRLRALLRGYQEQYSVMRGVVDASDLEALGGDPDGFFDSMHPATRNCDLILERIAAIANLP